MGEQGGKHQNGFPRILAEDVIHAYPTLCSSHSTYSYNSERLHLYPAFQVALLLHSPFWPGIPDSRSCTTCALYSIHFSHPPCSVTSSCLSGSFRTTRDSACSARHLPQFVE